jgi:phosphatidylinositol-3-phosphatase
MRWISTALGVLLAASACTTARSPESAPAVSAAPATSSAEPSPSAVPSPSAAGPIRPDHVVVVVFENKAFEHEMGNDQARYLNGLFGGSAVFTQSYAITHPSQPNYLALFSGSTQGVTDDRCLTPFHDRPNLGAQLIKSGLTFAGYSEGLPEAGYRGCSNGRYAAKHNPWGVFDTVPNSANLPFTAFPRDYSKLPTVSFVIPDLCNDMHDCGTAAGDAWAARNLEPYRRWAATHNSLLLITYDEDDGSAANRILTLISGAGVRPGQYKQRIDHYCVLRTLEDLYGLAPIGSAATARPITGIWTR